MLDYLQAWEERCAANGGIMPDNIGPEGNHWRVNGRQVVGRVLRLALAARSAQYRRAGPSGWQLRLLLTGDDSHLDLARSQLDMLWELRREEDGLVKVPARHGDQGWFDFRPPDPYLYIHLYYLSQSERDLARLDAAFPDRAAFAGLPPDWGAAKAGICPPTAWFAFIEGKNPGYVNQVIDSTYSSICHSLNRLENDDSDPRRASATTSKGSIPCCPKP